MQSFILLALLLMVTVEAFAPHPTSSSSAAAAAAGTTTTAVQYQNEGSATTATLVDFPVRTVVVPTKNFQRPSPTTTTTTTAPASLPRTTRRINTKPYIEELATLEELKYFLQEEDERPVVIK